MTPLSEPQRRDFLEIRVERHLLRSTILTSRTPLARAGRRPGDGRQHPRPPAAQRAPVRAAGRVAAQGARPAQPGRYGRRAAKLKRPTGFFAVGPEFERAPGALSDGAFKLFALLCLRAGRDDGRLAFRREELARGLGRSPASASRHLQELVRKGVCRLEAAPSRHRASLIEIRDEYRPCVREEAAEPAAGAREYVELARGLFGRSFCLPGPCAASDERRAAAWFRAGVPFERLRRAWLLGCARKAKGMVDRPGTEPIRGLGYFEPLLEEVASGQLPEGYWQHVETWLARCERHWRKTRDAAPEDARSNLSPAGAGPPSPAPSATAEVGRKWDDADQDNQERRRGPLDDSRQPA